MKYFYHSPYDDPYINLSIEDYLFRNLAPQNSILFTYVNCPSVIFGRFQNPFFECDLKYAYENNIKLVRRQSGGGTVYHDHGNLNFCWMGTNDLFSRKKTSSMTAEILSNAGVEVDVSDRFDLWKNGKKISGSAFKFSRNLYLHHGTLLLNADHQVLASLLYKNKLEGISKAIHSIISQTENLNIPMELILAEFKSYWEGSDLDFDHQLIKESDFFKKMTSKEWIIEETPRFTIDYLGHQLTFIKGSFNSCHPVADEATAVQIKHFADSLIKLVDRGLSVSRTS